MATTLLLAGTAAAMAGPAHGSVRGRVVDRVSRAPVAGATVELSDIGLQTESARDGSFRLDGVAASSPYRRIRAVVTAAGYGRWSISGVPLAPSDTLILNVELRRKPFDHQVLTPDERRANPAPRAPASTYDNTCTGWKGEQVPPETISVYITKDKKAETYDFDFYVTHVLPNEWIASWDDDALGAGAIAAKTYAAYRAMPNHAYSEGDGCADVVDSVADQVFDPTWSAESTDQAVYATLGSIYWKDGGLFLSQYYAGSPDDKCEPVQGEMAGRMSQWGTQTCATGDPPMLWPGIVTTYYDTDGNTEWLTLEDLMLNPGVENSQLYAWLVGSQGGTVITRIKGDAHTGNWYLQVTKDTTARVYQDRPFLGGTGALYHFDVAMRCKAASKDCSVTMKVIVTAEDGTQVSQKKIVTIKNDGRWHTPNFDPAAPGIAHVTVEARLVTKQNIDVDDAVLTGPFGGP